MSNPFVNINCCKEHQAAPHVLDAVDSSPVSKRRTRLNELDQRFGCSIIGTCVTLTELRKISHKAKIFASEHINDYDLHRVFVGISGEKSYANRRLQKLLDRKHKALITEFACADTQQAIIKLWKQSVKKGDVAGAFWALLTQPGVHQDLIEKVYGEVHMLSHISGASVRVDMQELIQLRQENKRLKAQQLEDTNKAQKQHQKREASAHQQEKQIAELQQEINTLKAAASTPASLEDASEIGTEINELTSNLYLTNSKLVRLEQKSAITFANNTKLEEQQACLKAALLQAKEDNASMEMMLDQYIARSANKRCQSEKICANSDLDGKCILYVGGRDRQCSHFRALVEHNNGHFIHHDGGKSDGSSKLYSTLAQADAVMCPLDCISHEAMINVKKHCKNSAKPLVMMPRSSYSAFSKGLSQISQ